MRYLFTLFTLVCVSPIIAQTNWEFDITDKSHSILIPSSLDGADFELGDYIGVFYEENNELYCAGYSECIESNQVLTAFGASFSLSGFQVGQTFHFIHWSASTNVEQEIYVSYNTIDFPHGAQFTIDGMSGISSIVPSEILGCTDEVAENYNAFASIDDGTCISLYEALYLSLLDSISLLQENHQIEIISLNGVYSASIDSIDNVLESTELMNQLLLDSLQMVSLIPQEILILEDSISVLIDNYQSDLTAIESTYSDSIIGYIQMDDSSQVLLNYLNDSLQNLSNNFTIITDSVLLLNLNMNYNETLNDSLILNSVELNDSIMFLDNQLENLGQLLIAQDEIINNLYSENNIQIDSIIQLNDIYTIISILENNIYELNEVVDSDELLISELQQVNAIYSDSILFLNTLYPIITVLEEENEGLYSIIDSLTTPINIELNEGWNMIGYGKRNEIDVVDAFSVLGDDLQIVKNNDGDIYFIEFGFNGIGSLIPGHGYQLRMYSSFDGFYFE